MRKRFFALDGIRGYAAFAVLVYHSILIYDAGLITNVLNLPIQYIPDIYNKLVKVALVIFDGPTAVMVFFILSGMVLSIALRKSVLHSPILLNLEFALKRITRIYPTLMISLIFFWASRVLLHQLNPNIFSIYGPKSLIYNALLINTIINGATWTLQIEILAIPFILFCFFVQKKLGLKGLMVIFFYLMLAFDNSILQIPIIPTILYQNFPPFVCGFLITSEDSEQFFVMLRKDSRIFIVALSGLFVAPLIARPLSFSSILVQLFCASIFLGGVYYRQFSPLLKILESRTSVYLGKISYSFYLNNVIFLYVFYPIFLAYFPAKEHPLEFGLLTTVICAVPAIILSQITEKYVEQPSIKLGKAITNLFSSAEKKYITPSSSNTVVSVGDGLPSALTENQEALQENRQS